MGAIASPWGFARIWLRAAACVVAAFGCVPALAEGLRPQVETVRFADPRWPAVRVVRGAGTGTPAVATASPPAPLLHTAAARSETVTFGEGGGQSVQIVRGAGFGLSGVGGQSVETIRFGGLGAPLVNVVRGPRLVDPGIALFNPATGGELDRVAFAVDGAESGHGRNPAMWRAELDGPQGPMQISAAAALDVGGGDRFDLRENRLLGRAFLAKMYQRYGNWPDAVAAYNWGPGSLDQWIAAGRPTEKLPLETARYMLKVLRDALMLGPS